MIFTYASRPQNDIGREYLQEQLEEPETKYPVCDWCDEPITDEIYLERVDDRCRAIRYHKECAEEWCRDQFCKHLTCNYTGD